jgi:hypothetical protein
MATLAQAACRRSFRLYQLPRPVFHYTAFGLCSAVLQQPQGTSIGEVAALAQEARGNITGEPLQLLLTPPRAPPAATPPRLPAGRTSFCFKPYDRSWVCCACGRSSCCWCCCNSCRAGSETKRSNRAEHPQAHDRMPVVGVILHNSIRSYDKVRAVRLLLALQRPLLLLWSCAGTAV